MLRREPISYGDYSKISGVCQALQERILAAKKSAARLLLGEKIGLLLTHQNPPTAMDVQEHPLDLASMLRHQEMTRNFPPILSRRNVKILGLV